MEKYMLEAIKEAEKALKNGDVPVGAVIVENGKIISRAHNQKENKKIATYHAEILAINKACKIKKTWYLNDCELYVTLEPCLMCAGAIIQSRIKKVTYSIPNNKFGFAGSIDNILQNKKNNHFVNISKGLCKNETEKMLKSFFSEIRK